MARPRKIQDLQIKKDKIQFSHPLCESIVGIRVASYPPDEAQKILEGCRKLLALNPQKKADVPASLGIHVRAIEGWFKPLVAAGEDFNPYKGMKEESKKDRELRSTVSWAVSQGKVKEELETALQTIQRLEGRIGELESSVIAKDATIEDLQITTGQRTEAERKTTLKALHTWFKENWKSNGKQRQTDEVINRCFRVCDKIGWDVRLPDVTQPMILKACNLEEYSDNEQQTRRQHIKRMFDWAFRPKQAGGLGFKLNPCEGMIVGDKVPGSGIIQSPVDILPKITDIHQRLLIAMMGYGGCRPSDIARLRWKDIKREEDIVDIKAWQTKTKIKHFTKPFPDFWKYLDEYKKVASTSEPDEPFLTRPNCGDTFLIGGEDPTEDGENDNTISDWLKKMPVTKEIPEPCRRLRRWYQTTMTELGYGKLAEFMASHSPNVADKHYRNWKKIADGITLPSFEQQAKEEQKKKVKKKK